jgi:putative serine protease PepD
MTATYDPFVPADASEQHGYGAERAYDPRGPQDPWGEDRWVADPHEQAHWTDDPRWPGGGQSYAPADTYAPAQGYAPSAYARPAPPDYPAAPAEYPPAPAAAPAKKGSLLRVVVSGLVLALLALAGFQAYRIQGVTSDNRSLTAGLTAEKGRTADLRKELVGVFDPEAVSAKVLPSVFRVRAGDFTGTAFSVKSSGGTTSLLTNYHVVDEVYSAGGRKVTLERGTTSIDATIVKVSKGKDLALLQASKTITPISAATATVKPGQQVVVVGAPLGLDDTVTSGVISAYRPNDPDGTTIQFDAAINPGNSGGPVVNAGDQVVGLATAKAKDAEGIGLAIPIATACSTFSVC